MTDQGPDRIDVPDQLRTYADQNIEQARKAFEEFTSAMLRASESMEGSGSPMHTNALEMNRRILDLTKENVGATLDYAHKLVNAKDVNEIMRLQTEYMRTQAETAGTQFRALTEQTMKAASLFGGAATKPR